MSGASTRALRIQIRQWRRGRANARLIDVIGDAYVAVFSTLILGSMLVSVLVNTGALTARSCAGGPCESARAWAPWLAILTALTLAGALARLFGPVFVSAATASWLLATPLPRRSLLRTPLALTAAAGAALIAIVAATTTAVAGFGPSAIVAITVGGLLAGSALIGAWAVLQSTGAAASAGAVLVWIPGIALEAGLILAWRGGLGAEPVPHRVAGAGWLALAVLVILAVSALAVSGRRLDRIRDRDLSAGGHLGAALSGALATLDLALVYDVVTMQRWRRRGQVRARRGGPQGLGALMWTDVIRLWRSPSRALLLLAVVPVPYAADALGAGRGAGVIAVVAGFLAALPLLTGVRVLTRTPGLTRMLPFTVGQARAAALAVPGACLLAFGLLVMSATPAPLPVPIALGALAAGTRWVTGRPPDYGRPLVSTPAGGVPANLYGSALRGFDVALLTGLPLLIPNSNGPTLSMALSGVVLLVLVNRKPTA